jgi:N-acetylglutamate synthase-like GNAT family acetyltransferase
VLIVRPASIDDVRPVQQAVLRPAGPLAGDQPHPADWLHFAAEIDGEVVGACSVGPSAWTHRDLCVLPAPTWQLRSMAVVPVHRGGVGARLLAAAVSGADAAGAESLWANARVAALNLYLRGGWQVVGEQWHKPGIGPHRYVVLTDPLGAHLGVA